MIIAGMPDSTQCRPTGMTHEAGDLVINTINPIDKSIAEDETPRWQWFFNYLHGAIFFHPCRAGGMWSAVL
jgi:hypothetical protein